MLTGLDNQMISTLKLWNLKRISLNFSLKLLTWDLWNQKWMKSPCSSHFSKQKYESVKFEAFLVLQALLIVITLDHRLCEFGLTQWKYYPNSYFLLKKRTVANETC